VTAHAHLRAELEHFLNEWLLGLGVDPKLVSDTRDGLRDRLVNWVGRRENLVQALERFVLISREYPMSSKQQLALRRVEEARTKP
jgi:hypothetical protein